MKKLNLEEIIKRINKVHKIKYEYLDLDETKNMRSKIMIKCPSEHVFKQKLQRHLLGDQCQKCHLKNLNETQKSIKIIKKRMRPTKEEMFEIYKERSKLVHKNKYNYSLFEFKNGRTESKIICPQQHIFEQSMAVHSRGHGCPKCWFEKIGDLKRSTCFFDKVKEIQKDLYDFSEFVYINNKTPGKIICSKHGEFWQRPDMILFRHEKCPKCSKVISDRRN